MRGNGKRSKHFTLQASVILVLEILNYLQYRGTIRQSPTQKRIRFYQTTRRKSLYSDSLYVNLTGEFYFTKDTRTTFMANVPPMSYNIYKKIVINQPIDMAVFKHK